ncbi:hypothetical protein BT63DRAFT_477446 [Microthyrium microscopicum]|uniref:Uncharacterized protein n=1 Tax=Microthyrium microscopicum TaxID=703497 RepID=A0A6A6UEZ6_9PEZI|nr:hypothetical protein BT63DRAFT_477446 [Microthyrium microscopicum]
MFPTKITPMISSQYTRPESNVDLPRLLQWSFREAPIEITLDILEKCFPPCPQVYYKGNRLLSHKHELAPETQSVFAVLATSPDFLAAVQSPSISKSLLATWETYSFGHLVPGVCEAMIRTATVIMKTAQPEEVLRFDPDTYQDNDDWFDEFGYFLDTYRPYTDAPRRSVSQLSHHAELAIELSTLTNFSIKLILECPSICSIITRSCLIPPAEYSKENQTMLLQHRISRAFAYLQLYVAMSRWKPELSDKKIIYWLFANPMGYNYRAIDGHQSEDVKTVLEWLCYLEERFSSAGSLQHSSNILKPILSSKLVRSLCSIELDEAILKTQEPESQWSSELHYALPFATTLRPAITLAERLEDSMKKHLKQAFALVKGAGWYNIEWRNSSDLPFGLCEAPEYRCPTDGQARQAMYCLHQIWPVIDKHTKHYKCQDSAIAPTNAIIDPWYKPYNSKVCYQIWYNNCLYISVFVVLFGFGEVARVAVMSRHNLAQRPRAPWNPSAALNRLIDADMQARSLCQQTLEVAWGLERPKEGFTGAYCPDHFYASSSS